jgi:hypothetical protein
MSVRAISAPFRVDTQAGFSTGSGLSTDPPLPGRSPSAGRTVHRAGSSAAPAQGGPAFVDVAARGASSAAPVSGWSHRLRPPRPLQMKLERVSGGRPGRTRIGGDVQSRFPTHPPPGVSPGGGGQINRATGVRTQLAAIRPFEAREESRPTEGSAAAYPAADRERAGVYPAIRVGSRELEADCLAAMAPGSRQPGKGVP